MSWYTSRRREALPENWEDLRKQVFKDKGSTCTTCRVRSATDIDHIVPGGGDSISNLTPLCTECHKIKSSREGARASAIANSIRKSKFRRTEERHPGLTGP